MTAEDRIAAFQTSVYALVNEFVNEFIRAHDNDDRDQYVDAAMTALASMIVAITFELAITRGKETAFIAAFRFLEKLQLGAGGVDELIRTWPQAAKITAAQAEDSTDALEALAGVLRLGLEGAMNFLKSRKTVV